MNCNLILIFLSIVILVIVASYDLNFFDYQPPIPYSNWKEISWDDFKGRNKPYFTLDGEDKFAFISTQIEAHRTNDGYFEITTYFHPSRSYVFNQRIIDNALLKHELYHLHITETIARFMRQEISTSRKSRLLDISKVLSTFQVKEDSMQRAYDVQTYHGYLLNKQKYWQKTIDSCLFSLEKFSDAVVKIK